MIFKQAGLTFAIAVLISGYLIISGCNRIGSDSDKGSIPKEVLLSSIVSKPDIDGKPSTEARYKTCQIFDFSSLSGQYEAIDTPFVYVRQSDSLIVVRLSNDVPHPYVFKKHGDYWHCKWASDERGDSIMIDRYIKDGNVYEYIQKRLPNSIVQRKLIKHDYQNKMELSNGYHFNELTHYLEPAMEFADTFDIKRYMGKRQPKPFDDYNKSITVYKLKDSEIWHQRCCYFTYSNGENQYSFSPLLIYDDHKDCQRIPALKRIK